MQKTTQKLRISGGAAHVEKIVTPSICRFFFTHSSRSLCRQSLTVAAWNISFKHKCQKKCVALVSVIFFSFIFLLLFYLVFCYYFCCVFFLAEEETWMWLFSRRGVGKEDEDVEVK